jgi:ribosomal protein S10
MEKQNIRIKLRAYDNKVLDASTEEIVNTVYLSFFVGSGIGPLMLAPVLLTVFTISSVD